MFEWEDEWERALDRSLYLVRRLRERIDTQAHQQIENYDQVLEFEPLNELMIYPAAWDYIADSGIDPPFVFCHPELLKAHPNTSLYYRGLCGLSQKRVSTLAVNVSRWEDGTAVSMKSDSFLLVACLYNTVVSSIIMESTNWTLENGFRTILATQGIQLDGSIRNLIGSTAQESIQEFMREWLDDQGYIHSQDSQGTRFSLKGPLGICEMKFGSEPDIGFWRDSKCIATIEVKGGTDGAGALERFGAMQKSFEEAPATAKNFLVVGVITSTLRERLNEVTRLERYFQLSDLQRSQAARDDFMEEVFNHALRITTFTAD